MEPRTLYSIGLAVVFLMVSSLPSVQGFAPAVAISMEGRVVVHSENRRHNSLILASSSEKIEESSSSSSSSSSMMNPNRPELPAVAGDYDWDAKYGNDSDWIMGSAVPGKMKLNDLELASQATALGGLEDKWRRERYTADDDAAAKTGFVPKAELLNGRAAMFFLVTGLLTEYWTGISIPGQVEELLRISGVIGFD